MPPATPSMLRLWPAALLVVVACGGATFSQSTDSEKAGDASADATADAAADALRDAGSDSAHADGGGGSDAAHGHDAASTPCGSSTCTGGDVCVVTTSGGGPCMFPDDAGICPNGKPANGQCCDNTTTTYECKPLPSSCNGALACPCATPLCQCGGCRVDQAPNTLECLCLYP